MKKLICATVVVVLYGCGIWISGWEPERGREAVMLFVYAIVATGVGICVGGILDENS